MVLMFLAEIDSELQLLDADISLIKVYYLVNCCYRTKSVLVPNIHVREK